MSLYVLVGSAASESQVASPLSPFAHPATFSLNHSPEATDRLRGNKNFDRRWEEEEGRKIKSNKSQLLRKEEFP